MAATSVVYDSVRNTTGEGGRLFEGKSFWFSSAVPQRKWLIENAVANGAIIVPLEKQADVLIVDHARKNAPVGTHSYRYVENSIRKGRLEDLADHVVGPVSRTDRPVGSMTTAPKGTRNKYTEAEDQLLWNFVKPYENAGGATGGNEIYKQLEEAHGTGRHTYQSWRDRWLKNVRFQNRQTIDSVYAGDSAEVGDQQAASPVSTQRQIPVSTSAPAPSPLRNSELLRSARNLVDQTRAKPEPSTHEDASVTRARESLQRKLGRVLPTSSGSGNANQWELMNPLPPQQLTQTEVVRTQRQKAGLGTYLEEPGNAISQESEQVSQSDPIEDQEHRLSQDLQSNTEEFTEEEYLLLLNATEQIIRSGDEANDESWENVAHSYPSHSARAWREFFEQKVKPDYEKQGVSTKEEQLSQDAERPPIALQESGEEAAGEELVDASSGESMFVPPSETYEDDGSESASGDTDIADNKVEQEDDGLDSLFESQGSSQSSEGTSPYACKWRGCDGQLQNLHILVQHVANAHKPSQKVIADEDGWTCHWIGCQGFKIDEYGNKLVFDLQTREDWVKHYIDEHMKPINLKYGLGPPLNEVHKVRRESLQKSSRGGQIDGPALFSQSDRVAEPQNRRKSSSQEDDSDEEEDVSGDEESEEAQETEPTSSPMQDAEFNDLISDKDDDDREHSQSPRRSHRLRNAPRPPVIKDLGFSYVDKAVGSSPPPPAQYTPEALRSSKSSTFQPLSPSFSKPPEPNEARKRSASKGTNSQESNVSQTANIEAIKVNEVEQPVTMPSPRKRPREPEVHSAQHDSPQPPARTNHERQSKRGKQHNSEEPLEIPSTPERHTTLGGLRDDEDDELGSSIMNGSPTPRPRPRQDSTSTSNPATLSRRNIGSLKIAGFGNPETEHTSPLHISMVSDADIDVERSSPTRSASTRPDDLSSEPDLHFETAPDTANLWTTAPSEELEEGTDEDAAFETAPESKRKGREELDTQSLFARSIPAVDADAEDPFALPEPDGGWPKDMDEDDQLGEPLKELSVPTLHLLEQAEENDDDYNDDEETVSIPSDIPGWITERTAEDPRLDVKTLLRAIQVTSGASRTLVFDVHDFLVSIKSEPQHMRGCWTKRDDEALKGSNREESSRILRKHGRAAINRRRWWLSEGEED